MKTALLPLWRVREEISSCNLIFGMAGQRSDYGKLLTLQDLSRMNLDICRESAFACSGARFRSGHA